MMEALLLEAHLLDAPTLGLADAAAVGVIVGVLQVLKTAIPALPARILPLLAMVAGVGFQFATVIDNGEPIMYVSTVIAGLIVGLAAVGAWSGGKVAIESVTQ